MRTLVTGGVKSGKSRYALDLARSTFSCPRFFIATATLLDGEMVERIGKHRAERRSADGTEEFLTIEEPVDLPDALSRAGDSVLLDCLPMWVNNLMYYKREDEFDALLDSFLAAAPTNAIVVTNETGLGNIPFDEYTRRYNRLLAEANRRTAYAFDRVVLMVAGIPLAVK
jgi:adenosylcobinamide kinase/adenosylcobinamide-phosphate guanylyltransferase